MMLKEMADYISIELPAAWERCADKAMEAYRPDWLEDYDFEQILDYYGFSEDYYKPRFRQELQLLKQDETLNRICWLMHYIMFYGTLADAGSIWGWKGAPKAFAEHGSPVTCVVAQLAGQPIHVKNMAERGYDDEQIAIHKAGVRNCWVGERNTYGVDGVRFSHMLWGTYFMQCHLVRLGRLQYEFGRKHYSKYDELFEGETAYVYIHIPPAKNGLRPEDVDASLQLAVERLKQYFPETEGKTVVFCTQTWLLSPELREILKPGSNIIQFQNRFHIAEVTETVQPFIGFGFSKKYEPDMDFSTLPEDTSLRRELKARLLRGEKLHMGFGYFTL